MKIAIIIMLCGALANGYVESARAQAPAGPTVSTTGGFGSLIASGKVIGPGSEPQSGYPVQIQGPAGKTSIFTDDKGMWSVYNLPPGDYEVKPLEGYSKSGVTAPITFSVKKKSAWEQWFGDSKSAYHAPEIKVEAPTK